MCCRTVTRQHSFSTMSKVMVTGKSPRCSDTRSEIPSPNCTKLGVSCDSSWAVYPTRKYSKTQDSKELVLSEIAKSAPKRDRPPKFERGSLAFLLLERTDS